MEIRVTTVTSELKDDMDYGGCWYNINNNANKIRII